MLPKMTFTLSGVNALSAPVTSLCVIRVILSNLEKVNSDINLVAEQSSWSCTPLNKGSEDD